MLVEEFRDKLAGVLSHVFRSSRVRVEVKQADDISYVYISVVLTEPDGVNQLGFDERVHTQDIENLPDCVIRNISTQVLNGLLHLKNGEVQ